MKTLILALSLLAAPAFADITIQPCGGFGATHQYHDCATDVDGYTVSLYLGANVFMADSDGETWTGPYAGTGLPSVLTNTVSGAQVTLVIDETHRSVRVGSGRGQHTNTLWTLVDGLIQ